jgi:opacity protein-like surface antigen
MKRIIILVSLLVLGYVRVSGQLASWTGVSVPVNEFGFTHKPAISYGAGWQNRSWQNRLLWQALLTRAVHAPRLDTIPGFNMSGPNYPYPFRPEKISYQSMKVWQLSLEGRFRLLRVGSLEFFGGVGLGAALVRTSVFRQIEGDSAFHYRVSNPLKCASVMATVSWRVNGHLSLYADIRYQSVSDFYGYNAHSNRSAGMGIWYNINDRNKNEAIEGR